MDIRIIDKDENGIGEIIGRDLMMLGIMRMKRRPKPLILKGFSIPVTWAIWMRTVLSLSPVARRMSLSPRMARVFPKEIESLLSRSEYVAESLVSGEDNQHDDIIVTATIFEPRSHYG